MKNNTLLIVLLIIIITLLILISILAVLLINNVFPIKDNDSVSNSETEKEAVDTTGSDMDKEISEAEAKSAKKKADYEQKYKYYKGLDRYTKTSASYDAEMNRLSSAQIQVYKECQDKINALYASNLGSGYKEAYKKQYEKERDQELSEISAEIADLKTSWENQQNYLTYYDLYQKEDERLEEEIKAIRAKYK